MFYVKGTTQEEIDKITFEEHIEVLGNEMRGRPFFGYSDAHKEKTFML